MGFHAIVRGRQTQGWSDEHTWSQDSERWHMGVGLLKGLLGAKRGSSICIVCDERTEFTVLGEGTTEMNDLVSRPLPGQGSQQGLGTRAGQSGILKRPEQIPAVTSRNIATGARGKQPELALGY